ncbi:molybdenum cofactor biosynthesis protein MoaE [bacterium]|jgi:molybdopterin synthase catalytic subunit|nr:molybdenum cofactor biosynthesis protein MoaE [bacterium]MDC0288623.1 molybdenum cofactor biosynthesis protein MoaE [Rubripirellula sp.]
MVSEEPHIELVDEPIQLEALRDRVDHPDAGAQGWFVGVTRRTTGDLITKTLHYEAHQSMAKCELMKLAQDAVKEFSLLRLVIVHRLGEVPIAQASVVIGCSSPHRPQTFAALEWIMNRLKKEVPIWKREVYSDGKEEWVHPGLNIDTNGASE